MTPLWDEVLQYFDFGFLSCDDRRETLFMLIRVEVVLYELWVILGGTVDASHGEIVQKILDKSTDKYLEKFLIKPNRNLCGIPK